MYFLKHHTYMILLKYPLPSNNMQASYIPIGLHSEMILLKCIYPS